MAIRNYAKFTTLNVCFCCLLEQKLLLIPSLGGTCVQHASSTRCCTPENAVPPLPPEKPWLRNTPHNAAIKELREAAGLSLRAELCCRPAERAAAQLAHILATTGIPHLQWKQARVACTILRQVSHLSAAHLVLADHWTYFGQSAGLHKLRKNVTPSLCYG